MGGRTCLSIGSATRPHIPAQHDVVEMFVAKVFRQVEEFITTGNVACLISSKLFNIIYYILLLISSTEDFYVYNKTCIGYFLYTKAQLRRALDSDSGISFLISHGTCVVAPHLDRLGETTLMWSYDICLIGSYRKLP